MLVGAHRSLIGKWRRDSEIRWAEASERAAAMADQGVCASRGALHVVAKVVAELMGSNFLDTTRHILIS